MQHFQVAMIWFLNKININGFYFLSNLACYTKAILRSIWTSYEPRSYFPSTKFSFYDIRRSFHLQPFCLQTAPSVPKSKSTNCSFVHWVFGQFGRGRVKDRFVIYSQNNDLFTKGSHLWQWKNYEHPLTPHCKNFNSLILSCHTWNIPKKCPSRIFTACGSNLDTSWVSHISHRGGWVGV